ncbi:MAG: bifunctional diaminohydroxyphosphoribosylaminopyrimidine deaminase/5-amino-6-(5-phosphoribosylamino)uracil reductase RibD [Bacteriovoracaceae bacterium]|nr:bifunctional diaminohydroxyphosphoribosylaminopyrimidine deaminase/5-amino-6-(5-phosphoribosylamino)uracil reductase RibD [Bacteriovoracaceae bacterium]
MEQKEHYIQLCFEQAKLGAGFVSPNPMVGAILVKEGRIIGKGYHQQYGKSHAEPNAIASATESVEGATLYCSLEPCCHSNKLTPPCTDLIIKSKISKVIISNLDPNPEVSGRGLEILSSAGIEIEHGVLAAEGAKLNRIFFKYITTKRPFLHLKLAQTLDGRIATETGDSKWITDESARTIVHQMRFHYDAVMVGRGTLNADNPSLDIRLIDNNEKIPYRIVVGNPEKMNWDHKILADSNTDKTVIINLHTSLKVQTKKLISDRKITLIESDSMSDALQVLGEMKISSILLEGGAILATSMIEEGFVDRISTFIAPKIIGNGPSSISGTNFEKMAEAIELKEVEVKSIGNQVLIEGSF